MRWGSLVLLSLFVFLYVNVDVNRKLRPVIRLSHFSVNLPCSRGAHFVEYCLSVSTLALNDIGTTFCVAPSIRPHPERMSNSL